MNKKIATLLTTVLAAGMVSSVPVAAESTKYPLTITNYNYEKEEVTYTYEKAPEKVVTIWNNSLENMLALGLGDRISMACGMEKEDILPELQEEAEKVEVIVGDVPTKEEIVALEPDMINGWYSTFGEKYWGDVDFWNERGCGTLMGLNSSCAPTQNLQNEYEDILTLGQIFDVQDREQEIVDEIQEKVDEGAAYAATQKPVRLLILENEKGVYRNYGENCIGGSIATSVGAELCAYDSKERLSAEDLVTLNPEIIFAVHFGTEEQAKTAVSDFIDNPAFANIDAVKNGKVIPIDLSLIYCPGIRVSQSVDFFLENIFPEM